MPADRSAIWYLIDQRTQAQVPELRIDSARLRSPSRGRPGRLCRDRTESDWSALRRVIAGHLFARARALLSPPLSRGRRHAGRGRAGTASPHS